MQRFKPVALLLNDETQAPAAGATSTVSRDFDMTAEACEAGLRIEVEATYTHVANTVVKLQHGMKLSDGTWSWADIPSTRGQVTLSSTAGATLYAITLNPHVSADAAVMPTRARLRVAAAVGVASALSVAAITAFLPELSGQIPARQTIRSV